MSKEEITYKDCIGIDTNGRKTANYCQVIEGSMVFNEDFVDLLVNKLTEANEKLEKIKEYVLGNRLFSIERTESEITKNKTCIPLYDEQISDTRQTHDILEIIEGDGK